MRILSNNLLASVKQNFRRKTNYKIYRKTENGWKVIDNVKKADVFEAIQSQEKHEEVHEQRGQETVINASNDEIDQKQPNYRQNEMKIQMLSQPLFEQIFKNSTKNKLDEQKIKRYLNSIATHFRMWINLFFAVFSVTNGRFNRMVLN